MKEFIKLNRVCVPLGVKCNLNCKYCYRERGRLNEETFPTFTPDMIAFLKQLDPSYCECVCASGGEPLIYWDKILEMFNNYVPKNVHKKVMTNGVLLTQDKIDYINENDIEVQFSHDGPMTKFLRGVDVLEDPKIANLVRQIKNLRIFGVVTKYNINVTENYLDTVKKLGRDNFYYSAGTVMINVPQHQYLVEGFNYNEFARHLANFYNNYNQFNKFYHGYVFDKNCYPYRTHPVESKYKNVDSGFNVLPNGDICGMTTMLSKYGTIFSTHEELVANKLKSKDCDYCLNNKNCTVRDICFIETEDASPHVCKVQKINLSINMTRF